MKFMHIKTTEYLAMVRDKTGFSDYKISKEYEINQSNLSKYSSGKAALSETHAWLFANILDIDPAEIVANTKLEHAISTGNNLKAKFWQEQLDKIFSESMPIKIQIAQINPIVGDIQSNAKKIIDLSIEAFDLGAHLVVFPELALTGYPPEDLLLRDGFMDQVKNEVDNLCEAIPSNISVLFGAPSQSDKNLYNSAYLIRDNQIQNIYNKQELPNYGVFDEKRYFTSGSDFFIFECQNTRIGVLICDSFSSKTFTVSITWKACLAQEGHDMIFTPLFLKFNDFRISFPIVTSFVGLSDKEILIVSPIPSIKSEPRPIDDLTLPDTKPPASVIPKCNG